MTTPPKTKPSTMTVCYCVADLHVDSFDPSIEGVEPITRAGTSVSADKQKEIRAKARQAGVKLHRKNHCH